MVDTHRPIYHFMPPAGWMNDPNGLIYWQGRYHLFYQHYPHAAMHRMMHWGHAVSDDLIHWQHLPIALAPAPGSVDAGGIWSGCAVDDDGTATLFYTGVHGANHSTQVQCLATSDHPDLITWTKYADNPVIATVPAIAMQTRDFRDPFVWQQDGAWYMVLASKIEGRGGVIFLYRSADLVSWEYLHPLLVNEIETAPDPWECPNFFPLGDKWVLLVSAFPDVRYFVGTYDKHQFTVETHGKVDHGCLYAPLTLPDPQGRRLLWGWLREEWPVEVQQAVGWSGVQSIPRVLALDSQNRLTSTPIPEMQILRHNPQTFENVSSLHTAGRSLEIVIETMDEICLCVCASPDGEEETRITCNRESLTVSRVKSSLNRAASQAEQQADLALDPDEMLRLHIFIDHSVIEIFANYRACISSRVYPARSDSVQVQMTGGEAKSVQIWQLESIWE